MKNNENIKYEFTGDIDEIIEEHGNTIIKLATVSWNDRSPKLEVRKWIVKSSTGDLVANKGITFSSREAVDNLVHTLIKFGYGDDEIIKQNLNSKDRSRYKENAFDIF